MLAKMKCSNCGAEISNLSMTWGWKQLLLTLPIVLIGMIPLLMLRFSKGDVAKALLISNVQKRDKDGQLEVVGLITNQGNRTWSSVTVEAEFVDASGAFLDEEEQYRHGDVAGKAEEHFKLTISSPSPALTAADTKMVVKVSGGRVSPF